MRFPSTASTPRRISNRLPAVIAQARAFFVFALALLGSGCVTPAREAGLAHSPPTPIGDDTRLARIADRLAASHPNETGFSLLFDGVDAFQARIDAIDAAERSIDAQTYIFDDDLTGRIFMERLLQAADRGVRVRLLFDDLAKGWKDRELAFAAAHPNIDIRLFNPPVRIGSLRPLKAAARFRRIHRRMHNKQMVVDGKYAIVGGRNIGDEYFDAAERLLIDLDAIALGKAIEELNRFFQDYWNYPLSSPVDWVVLKKRVSDEERQAFRDRLSAANRSPEALAYLDRFDGASIVSRMETGSLAFSWGEARAFADRPEKLNYSRFRTRTHLTNELSPYIEYAEDELILVSPYFIPGKRGSRNLGQLASKGVDIAIITNSLDSSNHPIVHAAYMKYRKRLLSSGVQLLETKGLSSGDQNDPKFMDFHYNAFLHTKLFLVDRRYVMIGSLNLDPRSKLLNTELMIALDSPDLAEDLIRRIKLSVEESYWKLELADNERIQWTDPQGSPEETASVEPGSDWLQRQTLKLLSLIPIEGEL